MTINVNEIAERYNVSPRTVERLYKRINPETKLERDRFYVKRWASELRSPNPPRGLDYQI